MDRDYQLETFRLESEHWWYQARREIILAQLRHRFKKRNDMRILDIGCGAGTLSNAMQQFGTVIGLEASAEAAAAAGSQSACEVRVGSIPDQVPPDLGSFNVVCLFDVIEHLDDDVAALRCAGDLLDEDGTLVVTVPALPFLFGIHDRINEHRRRYTKSSLTAALAGAGFERTKVSYFNTLLSPALIPAICWRNFRRSGHNFEVRTRLAPVLRSVFAFERHILRHLSLPFGLSLIALAEKG